jgi:hypothetical protein
VGCAWRSAIIPSPARDAGRVRRLFKSTFRPVLSFCFLLVTACSPMTLGAKDCVECGEFHFFGRGERGGLHCIDFPTEVLERGSIVFF